MDGTPDLRLPLAPVGVYSRIVESRLAREPAEEPESPEAAAGGLEAVVDDAGERIQELVDAAERVGALTESLGFRMESLKREAQALVDVLDEARRSLSELAEAGGAAPKVAAVQEAKPAPEPPPSPAPRPHPVPDARPATPPNRIPEQAVLRATQMAVAGTERAEIEQMLREEFGVTDAAGAVDQMLRSDRP
jgi:hypothetical protein